LQFVGTFMPNLVHAAIMLEPAATSTRLPLWVSGTMLNVTIFSLVECTDKIDGAKNALALARRAKKTKSDRAIVFRLLVLSRSIQQELFVPGAMLLMV